VYTVEVLLVYMKMFLLLSIRRMDHQALGTFFKTMLFGLQVNMLCCTVTNLYPTKCLCIRPHLEGSDKNMCRGISAKKTL